MKKKVLIMGAAGRDFHNFNLHFRDNSNFKVVAFTATQIPNIEGRIYPKELAGKLYPRGIPIYPESDLNRVIREEKVDLVVFSYSDVSHEYVMHRASEVLAAGADYLLLSPQHTMLESKKPVVAVCAVRTGAGKSQTARKVCRILRKREKRVVVVRHPMPYGDLTKQIVQRFAGYEDLDRYHCTIEEREEYEPHIQQKVVVYAGVDYEEILKKAQKEAEVIVWEGGNNDSPFFTPDLHIVVADPHRVSHELRYHPGETNLRLADVVVINKLDTAKEEDVERLEKNIFSINPDAVIIKANSPIIIEDGQEIKGKRVLVVEDGPTLTHGEMSYGAGLVAARKYGAKEIINPRPYSVRTIKETFVQYPQMGPVLPAIGYSARQIKDLEESVNAVPCDLVLVAAPIDLRRLMKLNKPAVRVKYELEEITKPDLEEIITRRLKRI
ncbi:MAG: cyclic 2,3-diphosphoglycerate synthase [Candidatus Edwardsbacteria bacterium]